MGVLTNIDSTGVFKFFEEICNIPHPSYKEKQISDYLVAFAKERNLEYYQDSLYNVIIIKKASEGYENVPAIIIQGHMDMVCEKDADCDIDMDSQGLSLYIEDDLIKARGTSLGGDDGIAVAMALAILDDNSLKHPRIEFVCTVSEEVGMDGAREIDVSNLRGKRLLNIDSEEEGILTCGCAGGAVVSIKLPVSREKETGKTFDIEVKDCTGGHSGTGIQYGRANANRMMLRILTAASSVGDIAIADISGGNKDNAIPRSSKATIVVLNNAEDVEAAMNKEAAAIISEYYTTDSEMSITVNESTTNITPVSTVDSLRMIGLMNSLPNGVIAMNQKLPSLVETSLNLGVMKLEDDKFVLNHCVRSNVDSSFDFLVCRMRSAALVAGARTTIEGRYNAWQFIPDSKMQQDLKEIFIQQYGQEPEISTVHAGLECSLFVQKIKDLDCVSLGPDIYDIHTSREALSISSTKRVYEMIVKYLALR